LNIDASVESYTIDGWMYRIGGLGDATFWLFYAGSGLYYYDSGKWWGHVQHGSGWSHEPQFGGVDDTWRHYAVQVTYEGAQYIVRVFVDGILRTYGSAPAASGVVTMVGTHHDATAGHRWDGIRVRKDFTLSSGTSLGQQYFNPLELYGQISNK
jgi:hypothetical protein